MAAETEVGTYEEEDVVIVEGDLRLDPDTRRELKKLGIVFLKHTAAIALQTIVLPVCIHVGRIVVDRINKR